jgi:hypothetical protein
MSAAAGKPSIRSLKGESNRFQQLHDLAGAGKLRVAVDLIPPVHQGAGKLTNRRASAKANEVRGPLVGAAKSVRRNCVTIRA